MLLLVIFSMMLLMSFSMLLLLIIFSMMLLMSFFHAAAADHFLDDAADVCFCAAVIDAYAYQMYMKTAPWVQTDYGEVTSLCPPCTSPCTRTWTEEARQNTSLQPRHTRTCDS